MLVKWVRYFCLNIMAVLTLYGWINRQYSCIFLGIIFLLINNILFCVERLEERMFFLLFQIMFFVFLLAKPLILIVSSNKLWYMVQDSEKGIHFALMAMFLSLLSMNVGAILYEQYKRRGEKKGQKCVVLKVNSVQKEMKNESMILAVQNISLLFFVVALVFSFVVSYEKITMMQGRSYLDYYTSYQSNLPALIHRLASMMKYALCSFLATYPNKKKSFIPLCLYVVSAIPDLYIGIRNPFVLNCLFVFVYYLIREYKYIGKKESWFGKKEKIISVVAIPVLIIAMCLYSDIRMDRDIKFSSIGDTFRRFFIEQGVSFDVLLIGYRTIDKLPVRDFRNYTFGGIIDYFLHGTIGQKIFGTYPLPNGNNIVNALESNRFAHNMSYVALGDEYLAGRGWGSSYLLELYTDYGYLGIIVFSLILGAFFVAVYSLLSKNLISRISVLMILTNIFFMPRGEATSCLEFLVSIQFWAYVGLEYFISSLFIKSYQKRRNGDV